MRGHTPGPWEWQNGCSWWRLGTRNGDGNVICPTTHPIDRHPDLIVSKEDRDLIEAAPEMLDALKFFASVNALHEILGTHQTKGLHDLIAKAEGRS